MQASLYNFLPDARPVLERMLNSSRVQTIIAEPIRNLTSSRNPVIAAVARKSSDPGNGESKHRFTEETLDEFLAPYRFRIARQFLIPGGREKIVVLDSAA